MNNSQKIEVNKSEVEKIDFRRRNLVFIDLETTGLDKHNHEIIEVGCLVVDGKTFEIKDKYATKVKPTHIDTADPKALKISGYTDEKWKKSIDLRTALEKIAVFSKDGMIAGWNVAFDWGFIEENFRNLSIESSFNYHKVDTQAIAYAMLYHNVEIKRLGLRHVAEYMGFDLSDVHSAKEDVQITYEVFKKLMALNEKSI